jgi:hypothetical protein
MDLAHAIFMWDDPKEFPTGNTVHACHDNGLTEAEVESILKDPAARFGVENKGNPIAFGYSADGRYLGIPFEIREPTTPVIRVITVLIAEQSDTRARRPQERERRRRRRK